MKPHTTPLTLALAVLSLAALFVSTQQQVPPTTPAAPGLFPPIDFRTNFASFHEVSATSTCGDCNGEVGGCSVCNNTCPHGEELPVPLELLEMATLAPGVVSEM